jgi:hypothetical protein
MKTTILESLHFDPKTECCSAPTQDDLFPSLLHLQPNAVNKGRVFSVHVVSEGLGVQQRKVAVDKDAWLRCSQSPHFDPCLKLAMARLALEAAIQ